MLVLPNKSVHKHAYFTLKEAKELLDQQIKLSRKLYLKTMFQRMFTKVRS